MPLVPIQENIPTLVYNCAHLPAICKNVNKVVAAGGSIDEFRYDTYMHPLSTSKDPKRNRKDTRRSRVCPTKAWNARAEPINQALVAVFAAPKADQPDFKIDDGLGVPYPVLMAEYGDVWTQAMAKDNRLYLKSEPDSYLDVRMGTNMCLKIIR